MRTAKLTAFSLGLALASTSAHATAYVYDGSWRIVGEAAEPGILHRQAWWLWMSMSFDKRGFTVDFAPVFTTSDCAGQPYIDAGYVDADGATPVTIYMVRGQWDGQAIWATLSDAQAITIHSQQNTDGSCSEQLNIPPQPWASAYAPAVKIEIPGFVPPFQVR